VCLTRVYGPLDNVLLSVSQNVAGTTRQVGRVRTRIADGWGGRRMNAASRRAFRCRGPSDSRVVSSCSRPVSIVVRSPSFLANQFPSVLALVWCISVVYGSQNIYRYPKNGFPGEIHRKFRSRPRTMDPK